MAATTEAIETERDGSGREAAVTGLVETVAALIDLMRQGGISKLDVSVGDVSIKLRGGAASPPPAPLSAPPTTAGELIAAPPVVTGHIITAPMVGTFYVSAAPGEPPFVRVGEAVESGQVVGIIEAMKIMNEIAADKAGVVEEIIAANGQAVEYGSPLVRLGAGDEAAT